MREGENVQRIVLAVFLLSCLCIEAQAQTEIETQAQEPSAQTPEITADTQILTLQSMQLSTNTRGWFRNPDGSCVQCSIGMAGVHCNDIKSATLLWDTEYGRAIRGGSWPGRVANYCDERGIKAWNVTGDTTIDWCRWAAKTGRFAAIGAFTQHFQTLYGFDPSRDDCWMVCNNNSTSRIDYYTEKEFRSIHYASGPWVVVLQKSSSENPVLVEWWR